MSNTLEHAADQITVGVYPIGDKALKALEAKDTILHWVVSEVIMRERNVVSVRMKSNPHDREAVVEMTRRQWDHVGAPAPDDKLTIFLEITKVT
jgi:hypothetical protein